MILLLATFFLFSSCVAEVPSSNHIKEQFMGHWWQSKDKKLLDDCFLMSEAKYIYMRNTESAYYGGSWEYTDKDNIFDVVIDGNSYQVTIKRVSKQEWKVNHSLLSFGVVPCDKDLGLSDTNSMAD